MKTILFYTVVIGVPLVVIVYFFFKVSTVVFVHNAGAADTQLSLVIDSARGYERTEDRGAKAGNIALLEFTPQTEGALSLNCKEGGHKRSFPLGYVTSNTFFGAWVTLASCERLVSNRVYTF